MSHPRIWIWEEHVGGTATRVQTLVDVWLSKGRGLCQTQTSKQHKDDSMRGRGGN